MSTTPYSLLAVAPSTIVLTVGVLILLAVLAVLMISRWGQARPVSKCVALSVFAHIILLGYASTIKWLDPRPWGDARATAQVRWVSPTTHGLFAPPLDAEITDPVVNDPAATPIVPVEDATRPAQENRSSDASAPPGPQSHDTGTTQEPEGNADTDRNAPVNTIGEAAASLVPPAPEPSPQEVTAPRAEPTAEPVIPTAVSPRDDPIESGGASLSVPDEPHVPAVAARTDASPPSDSAVRTAADGWVRQPRSATAARSDPLATSATSSPGPSESPSPAVPPAYAARLADRTAIVAQYGGDAETEAAVQAALRWLANNQDRQNGCWSTRPSEGHDAYAAYRTPLRADNGITGLALLTFLAAGHTHQQGVYADSVRRGLSTLLRSQSHDGSLAGVADARAAMYCHAIATLAVSEAYLMTRDDQLRPALQRAAAYTIAAQHPVTGGWRYRPGDLGDTSQFGWQVMALTSARTAGLRIPKTTDQRMRHWIDQVSAGRHQGLARYRPLPGEPVSRAMTAETLACRIMLDYTGSAATLDEAVQFLIEEPPVTTSGTPPNFYYWYYATLALFQLQTPAWDDWNRHLKASLIRTQRRDDPLSGSWDPDTVWGPIAGRVYTTALATLCLEVYYRYLPLMQQVRGQTKDRQARWSVTRTSNDSSATAK